MREYRRVDTGSGRNFRDNQARLRRFALAYNLGHFLRRLALPHFVKHRSLTILWAMSLEIRATIVRVDRYVTFQMAEVAMPRDRFSSVPG
jgi:hypothetical protein